MRLNYRGKNITKIWFELGTFGGTVITNWAVFRAPKQTRHFWWQIINCAKMLPIVPISDHILVIFFASNILLLFTPCMLSIKL